MDAWKRGIDWIEQRQCGRLSPHCSHQLSILNCNLQIVERVQSGGGNKIICGWSAIVILNIDRDTFAQSISNIWWMFFARFVLFEKQFEPCIHSPGAAAPQSHLVCALIEPINLSVL